MYGSTSSTCTKYRTLVLYFLVLQYYSITTATATATAAVVIADYRSVTVLR